VTGRRSRDTGLLAVALACLFASEGAGQGLSLQNTSRALREDWWSWTLFVTGPGDQLASVECVEYRLHPTFPNPVQKVCRLGDPDRAFALEAQGWGVFDVEASLTFKDPSRRPMPLRHRLRFDPLFLGGNTCRQTKPGWWEWTAFIKAPESTLDRVKCVRYTLPEALKGRTQEVCNRGCGLEAFPFRGAGWGRVEVAMEVTMKDGTAHKLLYPLALLPPSTDVVEEFDLAQKTFHRTRIAGSPDPVYVYVGDIAGDWPTNPFTLEVAIARGESDSPGGDFQRWVARVPEQRRWKARMRCEGSAVEFTAAGRPYVLVVRRVKTVPGRQADSVRLAIVPAGWSAKAAS
jgi:hypothetical protein